MPRIASVSVQDTFGTRVANFAPGSVTRISGANGLGKSSILRGLIYVFSGGLDASVIRKGAEKSIVSFSLDNGVTVTKTTALVKPRRGAEPNAPPKYRADLEITDSDGSVINAPQGYLAELSEALAVDPSVLLRIDTSTIPGKRELAAQLMKLVPISFDPEEVNRACSYRSSDQVPFHEVDAVAIDSPADALDLDMLKKTVATITEQRRRIGQTKNDSEGAVNRLQKALPQDDGADHSGKLSELEAYIAQIEKAVADERVNIEKTKADALASAKKKASDASVAADLEYTNSVAVLEEKRSKAKSEAAALCSEQTQTILKMASEELADLEKQAQPHRERTAAELATVKERIEAHARAATLRQEIEVQLATHRESAWKYDQLSGVLQRLEALRLEKLNHLPVAGLVVEDGQAFIDGVEWGNNNLARRVEAVLQICTQRSGKLQFLLIDDSEHLSPETRTAIEQGLVEAGYQVIEAAISKVCTCGHEHPEKSANILPCHCGCEEYVPEPLKIETII